MPTVEMKLPARKAASLKRTSRQVFPTPESPTSITCAGDGKTEHQRAAVPMLVGVKEAKVWVLLSWRVCEELDDSGDA